MQRADTSSVVLGEDWTSDPADVDPAVRAVRRQRGLVSLRGSPLARRIVVFNLLALMLLVGGVLFLNPFRDSLVQQREAGMITEVRLVANAVAMRLPPGGEVAGSDPAAVLAGAQHALVPGTELFVYDQGGRLVSLAIGAARPAGSQVDEAVAGRRTFLVDALNALWSGVARLLPGGDNAVPGIDSLALTSSLVEAARAGRTAARTGLDQDGATLFAVATPIRRDGAIVGVAALSSAAGEIDRLVRHEREQILRMFLVALVVSVVLSLLLASTIANPLADLAFAAELGRDRNARRMAGGRVRIPDLTARPDEIGRLSGALRGMVAALYDRIEANEQFAADVAHEIKNPLASLRSAVGSLHMIKKEEQRQKLLDVIDHDIRRLDRLVSDISNASRLDSELVKEDEEEFNLIRTLNNINQYHAQMAAERGVDFITDLPAEPIMIHGLEGRLAQVFVNLITNAISFCQTGDAVRVWVRRRDSRVLVVVEDTGPGIPEQALGRIFRRFYSERPVGQFGEHSGLGLAISKQIVEAHGGVIWAENIRPTDEDATSDPLGARFVVGLPV